MIERLKQKDIEEAARVYNKGLLMQIPKAYADLEETMKHLKKLYTFVYKEHKEIKGLVSFKENNKIKVDFICVLVLRKGIGKKLMMKLSNFAVKKNIKFIYSNVSSKDRRVINFYETCGFEIYGKPYISNKLKLYKIKAKPEWIEKSLK